MSAVAATLPPLATDARPGLARLTGVELRKMIDTRAGFWLQFVVVVLTIALIVVFTIFGPTEDLNFMNMLLIAVQPAGFLLPVIGILLVSSEWSQRTGLITFTLVPRRSRVLAAKLAAAVVLSIAVLALCLIVAAVATLFTAADADQWRLPAEMLGQIAVFLTTAMITGVAFGAALLASAPAIVLYFALPIAWSIVASLRALEDVARWLDGSRSLAPLTDHVMSATEWAHAGTTLALWMVLPLLVGVWRVTRREVRA